jgi:hypothetical protein
LIPDEAARRCNSLRGNGRALMVYSPLKSAHLFAMPVGSVVFPTDKGCDGPERALRPARSTRHPSGDRFAKAMRGLPGNPCGLARRRSLQGSGEIICRQ